MARPASTQMPLTRSISPPPPPSADMRSPTHSNTASAAAAAAAAAAKKKKKKGKGKKTDDGLDALGMPPPSPNHHLHHHAFSATAQAQADLIATASDLYRRIEADPQGIPDDDAYWTSLPAHLRTFIRNALPIGQLPPSAAAAAAAAAVGTQGSMNDPNARQASTQAMIAVAQQLAQAAHASQRHLQQYPPSSTNLSHGVGANVAGNNAAYPPFPFDPSIFADLALHADQPVPLHPHPNSLLNGSAAYGYGHHTNPPPTLPPNEALPAPSGAPAVLLNEYDDEAGDFEDDYYSDEELDAHDPHAMDGRDGRDGYRGANLDANGNLPSLNNGTASSKKKNKKKKKKGVGATHAEANPPPAARLLPPVPVSRLPTSPTSAPTQPYPASNTNYNSTARQAAAAAATQPPPPPSSRAAGKQPMTFNSAASGKTPAATTRNTPPNGLPHGGAGKRAASTATSSHGHGSINGHHNAPDGRGWSSGDVEERERVKAYWITLNEKDRAALIREEKEGVLKRMREQQRHTCHCAICLRKRRSIEDELDVLYDGYYNDLDSYAQLQRKHIESKGQAPPPPGPGPFPGSVALDSQGAVIGGNALAKAGTKRGHTLPPPTLGRRNPLPPEEDDVYDDDDLEDDEYDDEYEYEDDEDEEDDLNEPEIKPGMRRRTVAGGVDGRAGVRQPSDFYNFGTSLTIKGIVAVADDLLRNDGRKFLEMMEQLADRRMLTMNYGEGSDDADHDQAAEVDDLEEDALSDQQRIEDGRRMFQIFAARMFEQRVSQAYRERIAQERQLQLLRELEEEDIAEKEKEAKRAKENQKKKDKKKQVKAQKEEERMRHEREKAAEEAAAREKQGKQREAELRRQEEIRLKRESEKKAKEEERQRKEDERRKRQDEERAREMEKERKKREKEDRVRHEREAKEREERMREEEVRRNKEAEQKELKAVEEKKAATAASRASAARLRFSASPAPKSPTSAKSQAAPRSPAAATQQALSSSSSEHQQQQHRARGTPSTSPGANHVPFVRSTPTIAARPPGITRSSAVANQSQILAQSASSTLPALSASSSSSLPAPPQGLPARPTTSIVTQPSPLPASLPRPPIQQPALSASGSTVPIGVPVKSPAVTNSLPVSPPPGRAQFGMSAAVTAAGSSTGAIASSLSTAQTPQPLLQQQQPVPRFGSTFGNGPVSTVRSPSTAHSNGPLSTFGGNITSLPAVGMTTAAINSLNLGHLPSTVQPQPQAQPHQAIGTIGGGLPSSGTHSRAASHDERGKMGSTSQYRPNLRPAPGPIGPIGRPRDPSHDEFSLANGGNGLSTLPEGILGSSALGGDDELVEPQPRRVSHHAAPIAASPGPLFGASSNGGSGSGSGVALGGGGGGAFGMSSPWSSAFNSGAGSNGASSSNGALSGAVGMTSNAVGVRHPSSSANLGSGMLQGALVTSLSSPNRLGSPPSGSSTSASRSTTFGPIGLQGGGGMQQLPGHLIGQVGGGGGSTSGTGFGQGSTGLASSSVGGGGCSGGGSDPWLRTANGWDRARYAFEQPSPITPSPATGTSTSIGQQHPNSHQLQQQQQQHHHHHHHHSHQHGNGQAGGSMGSPFGTHVGQAQQYPHRNMFGAPGSGVPHSSEHS